MKRFLSMCLVFSVSLCACLTLSGCIKTEEDQAFEDQVQSNLEDAIARHKAKLKAQELLGER